MLGVDSVEKRIYPAAGVLFEFSFTFPLKKGSIKEFYKVLQSSISSLTSDVAAATFVIARIADGFATMNYSPFLF